MKKKTSLSLSGIVIALIAAFFYNGRGEPQTPQADQSASPNAASVEPGAATRVAEQPAAKRVAKPAPVEAPLGNEPVAKPPVVEQAGTAKAPPARAPPAEASAPVASTSGALPASTSRVGFTSYRSWQSHFEKHGREFGNIDADEYLARAKALRDAPLSSNVLELERNDGVITRFDKVSGGFVAFHGDRTIRTFFRPNDGEAYFRRQARR